MEELKWAIKCVYVCKDLNSAGSLKERLGGVEGAKIDKTNHGQTLGTDFAAYYNKKGARLHISILGYDEKFKKFANRYLGGANIVRISNALPDNIKEFYAGIAKSIGAKVESFDEENLLIKRSLEKAISDAIKISKRK
jgi:hypothetical protein